MVVRKSLFYEITSPLFDKVTIHLDNRYYSGKTFQIITKGNSTDNMYIQNASLNGKKWNKCWFYHEDFIKGGTLELKLGAKPNKKWGCRRTSSFIYIFKIEIKRFLFKTSVKDL